MDIFFVENNIATKRCMQAEHMHAIFAPQNSIQSNQWICH